MNTVYPRKADLVADRDNAAKSCAILHINLTNLTQIVKHYVFHNLSHFYQLLA